MIIESGRYVKFSYAFSTEEGQVVYQSNPDDPPWYIHGCNLVMPAMEEALTGLEQDQTVKINLPPEKAFGERLDHLVGEMPLDSMPGDEPPQVGMVLQAQSNEGQTIPVTVLEIKEETVVIDGNHPLAGLTLDCELKALEVREATAEETAEVDGFLGKHNVKRTVDEDGSIILELGPDDPEEAQAAGCSSCHSTGSCCDGDDDDSGCGSGGCCS